MVSIIRSQKKESNSRLFLHLLDLLIVQYFSILVGGNFFYGKSYPLNHQTWVTGWICKAASFIVLFFVEATMLTRMILSTEFLIIVRDPFHCEEYLDQYSYIRNFYWVLPAITSALQTIYTQSKNSLCLRLVDYQQSIPAIIVISIGITLESIAVIIQTGTSIFAAYEIWRCCQKSGRNWLSKDTKIVIRMVSSFAITFSNWLIIVVYLIYESIYSHGNAIVTSVVVIALLILAALDAIVHTLSLGEFIAWIKPSRCAWNCRICNHLNIALARYDGDDKQYTCAAHFSSRTTKRIDILGYMMILGKVEQYFCKKQWPVWTQSHLSTINQGWWKNSLPAVVMHELLNDQY